MGELLDLLKKTTGGDQSVAETTMVLLYELGDFAKALMLCQRKPEGKDGYIQEMRIALGDIFVQWSIICESLGLDPYDVRQFGVERFYERMRQVRDERLRANL